MDGLGFALSGHDERSVRELLAPDATLVIDSGGLLPETSSPLEGREAAATALLALMTAGTSPATASINGVPGMILIRRERVVAALTAQRRSRHLSAVWVVCNPDKLRHWNR